jgi:hypothetical protein
MARICTPSKRVHIRQLLALFGSQGSGIQHTPHQETVRQSPGLSGPARALFHDWNVLLRKFTVFLHDALGSSDMHRIAQVPTPSLHEVIVPIYSVGPNFLYFMLVAQEAYECESFWMSLYCDVTPSACTE